MFSGDEIRAAVSPRSYSTRCKAFTRSMDIPPWDGAPPWRCRKPSQVSFAPDPEQLVQGVAEQTEDDHAEEHRQAGERHRPPVGEEVGPRRRDHAPPLRRGRL